MDLGNNILIMKKNDNAIMPKRATSGSAGMDLCACIEGEITLKCGEIKMIPTGVAIAMPNENMGAFIFARSGLATKHGISLVNAVGVVDSDYRGEIKVGVINLGGGNYTIKNGDRIAQLVFMPVLNMNLVQVDSLDETERGERGFGSTGKSAYKN